jgi:hypothetical protein
VAAEINVGLERAPLHFVEIHAVQGPVHEILKIERAAPAARDPQSGRSRSVPASGVVATTSTLED